MASSPPPQRDLGLLRLDEGPGPQQYSPNYNAVAPRSQRPVPRPLGAVRPFIFTTQHQAEEGIRGTKHSHTAHRGWQH